MMKNTIFKPQRKNLRLEGYDYSSSGNYFITIVTQKRINLFGEIIQEELIKAPLATVIDRVLLDLPIRYTTLQIPHYVVMSNHIHLIVQLYGQEYLSEIIGWFKGYTTNLYIKGIKEGKWTGYSSRLWQRNYFEHIIRNQRSYDYIADYIVKNPVRWRKDKMNPRHDEDCDDIMKQVLAYG